ncbi:hypothetical protein C7374_12123 [Falsochrobactrum ovis]|uniref:Uncharacterized protein n=1 Tax=Falsochrobactrum ovis TaxID=1293442 RepID=A0A364JSC4_9HYPH|nr:hypothetical protein C7374_12123 [Falsochrobactrum ovis]
MRWLAMQKFKRHMVQHETMALWVRSRPKNRLSMHSSSPALAEAFDMAILHRQPYCDVVLLDL